MANKYQQIKPFIRGTLAIKNMPNNLMLPMTLAHQRQLDVSQQPLLKLQPATLHQNDGFAVRSYCKAAPPDSSLKINLPDKHQVEKYFFRTLAFVYDNTATALNWSFKNFQQYIVENSKVQEYWNMLLQKMEKSKQA